MARVRVRVDDFEDGAMPPVCASSGATADGIYEMTFTRTPGWAVVIAFLLFPWGLIVVPFARTSTTGYLPFAEAAQQRMRDARRVALQRLALLGTCTVLLTWGLWLLDHDTALAALVIGLLGCAPLAIMASRPRGSVGGRLDPNGRWLRLDDVDDTFATAYLSQLERRQITRRADAWAHAAIETPTEHLES